MLNLLIRLLTLQREISRLHGVPIAIVFYRDTGFTLIFWKRIFEYLDTNINFSTTYHPQINGKIERVNQVIEYKLHMYVMDKPSKWEYYLHFVNFAYSNGNCESLKMSLIKVFMVEYEMIQ